MSQSSRDLLVALLLASLAFAAHARALNADLLHWDDHLYVFENPAVVGGLTWQGVKFAFTNTRVGPNWVPMAFLSHLVDVQIFGLRAWGHHLTGLLFHAANAGLLFWVLKRFTGATWRSALVAAIFAVHPVHVESVAWVAERRDVLSLFFGLLALLAYQTYTRVPWRQGWRAYLACWLCTGLAVMSKPMLVTLPCLFFVLDYWPLARLNWDNWYWLALEKLPLTAWSILSAAFTLFAQQRAMDHERLELRIQSAVMGLGQYLQWLVWPVDLSPYYPWRAVYPPEAVAATLAVLAVISVAAIMLRRRSPYLLAGWLWFLGTMIPVIGLVQVGSQRAACRYAYLPFIGLYIALVWAGAELVRSKPARQAVAGVMAVVVLLLAVSSWDQTGPWLHTVSLMRQAVAVSPGSGKAWFNLADALAYDGKTNEALAGYEQAVRCEPTNSIFLGQLATAYLQTDHLDQAQHVAHAALLANPTNTLAMSVYGQCLMRNDDLAAAAVYLTRASRLSPDDAEIFYNLGLVRTKQEDMPHAAEAFTRSLQLDRQNAPGWYYLGYCESELDQPAQAIDAYRHAIALRLRWSEAHDNLGTALAGTGRLDLAAEEFRLAVQFDPANAKAAEHLARAEGTLGHSASSQPGH